MTDLQITQKERTTRWRTTQAALLFVLVVGLWWGLRLLGLYSMRAFRELELRPLHLAQALTTDVIWLLALAVLGHGVVGHSVVGARMDRGDKEAVGRQLLSRRLLGWGFFTLLCIFLLALRVSDSLTCYFALAHMTKSVWHHVSLGSLGYVRDPRALAMIAAAGVSGASLAWALARIGGALPGTKRQRVGFALMAVAITWGTPALQKHDPHH